MFVFHASCHAPSIHKSRKKSSNVLDFSLMADGCNYYKIGAVLYLITVLYVLVALSPNSVEAVRSNKAYNNFQAPQASSGSKQYCSHPPCKHAPDKVDGRFGDEKRRVPTGPNPLHN